MPPSQQSEQQNTTGLGTVDENFPLQLWCKFLPQMHDSLNMMRISRRNAKIGVPRTQWRLPLQ